MRTSFKMMAYVMLICCICMSNAFAESSITVNVDGEAVSFTDAAPFVDANNRTQVPMRAIAEALGCSVDWNDKEQKAIIKKDFTEVNTLEMWRSYDDSEYITLYEYSREMLLTIGSNVKIVNFYNSLYGEVMLQLCGYSDQEMDTSPIVKDNRTYLPAKYLAEAFGFNVSWDAATQAVNILAKNSIVGSYISDVVSSFEDSCAIALYETDYTALNREFIDIESAKIVFRDGRSIDVTESFVDATDELKAVFTEMGWDIDVAYAGKIQYDFSPEENQLFQLQVKAKIADTEGNIGHQYYTRIIDISDGQGGYL